MRRTNLQVKAFVSRGFGRDWSLSCFDDITSRHRSSECHRTTVALGPSCRHVFPLEITLRIQATALSCRVPLLFIVLLVVQAALRVDALD